MDAVAPTAVPSLEEIVEQAGVMGDDGPAVATGAAPTPQPACPMHGRLHDAANNLRTARFDLLRAMDRLQI